MNDNFPFFFGAIVNMAVLIFFFPFYGGVCVSF